MKLILFFCFLIFFQNAIAQYHGGINDGHSQTIATNQNAIPNIFSGGINDGVSQANATNQNAIDNIYLGGVNDGVSQALTINQNATPNIYMGGANDGTDVVLALNQNATVNIYTGGINDGISVALASNQNAVPSIYFGGINDGADIASSSNQNAIPNIYKGGINDGFASITVTGQNNSNSLPLILISFNGNWQADDAALSWIVSQDRGIDYYELERSADGNSFTEIGRVISKNTDHQNQYDYLDISAARLDGTALYYRLKSWDKSGNFQYSAVVRLSKNQSLPTMILYPNPTGGHFTLQFSNAVSLDGYDYMLNSSNGALIAKGKITDSKTGFDISNNAPGIYTLSIYKNAATVQNFKIILTK